MTAAWIGSDVRATAMSHRVLGRSAARALAAESSIPAALTSLVNSPYGHEIRADLSLEAAQHAVAATALWNMRVLAGWVPATGIPMMRVLVAWYEIANIEAQLRSGFEAPAQPYFRLGGLAVGWGRLSGASNTVELCDLLATTAWGRPDDETPHTIGVTLRSILLQDAAGTLPGCRDWVASAAALLLARERSSGRQLPPRAERVLATLLGGDVVAAPGFEEFIGALPENARWAFDGVAIGSDLWRAESRWWSRVESDGVARLRGAQFGPLPVIGAVAVLAADAWRVRAALTAVANGARGLEEFDALA
jgi:hypothetical protein